MSFTNLSGCLVFSEATVPFDNYPREETLTLGEERYKRVQCIAIYFLFAFKSPKRCPKLHALINNV